MKFKVGQKVYHKNDMQEGIVVEISDTVAEVVFQNGDLKHVHYSLLAEKIDGSFDDDRSFLTE